MSAFARDPNNSEPMYWPKHLLPQNLPSARVFTYGYDTKVRHALGAPISRTAVYDIASDFLGVLEAERRPHPARPLMFIAHSLGGIVVKEMLRQSHRTHDHHTHLREIYKATAAVIFFGTPHGGADPRGFPEQMVEQIGRAVGITVNEQIVDTLLPTSERLRELRDEFGLLARREGWIIYSFQEQYGVQFLRGKKVVEDVSSCLGDPSLETTQHIASEHMEMCRFSGIEDHEYRKVIGALDLIKTRLSDKQADIEQPNMTSEHVNNQRHLKLDAMWFRAADARYATIKAAHAKTCKWFLQRLEYHDWLDVAKVSDHHGLLWIKGKPGSGKSTLLKFAVQSIRRSMKKAVIICFFFNARGEDLEKSTLGMYRSLISQLLRGLPDLQEVLDNLNAFHDAETFDWQIDRLQDLFATAVQRLGERHLICFIDALDESDEDEIRDLVKFLETLGRPGASSPKYLRVCLSSRHYPHISITNAIEMTLEGQEGHVQDISNFLDNELKAGGGAKSEAIKREILDRASGVFLWVALVVQILNKEFDHGRVHALRKRLKEIPDGLDKLFEDILTRDNAHFEELILCLQWILYAKRPLKREELYYAILSGTDEEALTPWEPELVTPLDMDKFVLSCSKGLAETTKSKSQTVQFIHESVRDFLLGNHGINRLRAELSIDQSHESLRRCCYLYMQIDVSSDLPDGMELPKASTPEAKDLRTRMSTKFPFLEYSVHNLLWHANYAGRHGISQKYSLSSLAIKHDFPDKPSPYVDTDPKWLLLNNLFEQYQVRRRIDITTSNLLSVLVQQDLSSLVATHVCLYPHIDSNMRRRVLVEMKVSKDMITALFLPVKQPEAYEKAARNVTEAWPNFVASTFKTFLPWAAFSGQESVIRSLFGIGVISASDCNLRDELGRTPLWLAVLNRHHAVVKLLLTNKVNPDLRDKKYSRTPLLLSVINNDPVVLEILLLHKAYPDKSDADARSPLMLAAMNGHMVIVELLLAKKADRNPKDLEHRSALLLGTSNGHKAIVRLLLANGATPNIQDNQGRSPLISATTNGDQAMVEVLLRYKANPNVPDTGGNTALRIAARNGHSAIVELLLASNAFPDFPDKEGRSPLMLAAIYGHEAVVKELLSCAARPHYLDCTGSTALILAATYGHAAVVDLLQATEAISDTNGSDSDPPLILAAKKGNQAVIKALVDGIVLDDRHDRSEYERSPLQFAARKGHDAVIRFLIENKHIAKTVHPGRSTTEYLSFSKETELLIPWNADLDTMNKQGLSPLMLAVISGCKDTVRLLLKNRANANVRGSHGRTPLIVAAENGDKATSRQLFENTDTVLVDASDVSGRTALMHAARSGHYALVKLILENTTNLDDRDEEGKTALMHAVMKNHNGIVELLLVANLNIEDNEGNTPLMLAVRNGDAVITMIILNALKFDSKGQQVEKALSLADLRMHPDVVDLLRTYLRERSCYELSDTIGGRKSLASDS
ncbi:MAG: hypothetical protein Q9169_004428 [Polycauliona sp. 2 TL-2023]